MIVTDLPQPSNHALYDQAITRYAELVRPRALAVYRVGHVRHPGVSDVDLLVVTDRMSLDNRHYFSALERMPEKFLPLFLHEPYVLPAWSLRIIQHTTHYKPALLSGRDLLRPYAPQDSNEERWCRMLESYCSYADFAAQTRSEKTLSGRRAMTVANSYRYLVADSERIFPVPGSASYAQEVDRIGESFFKRPNPADGVLEAWNLFAAHFDRFDAALRERLQTGSPEQTLQAVHKLLRGEHEFPGFDREFAFRRARDIDGYHQELASLGFPYGQLFFAAAHPLAVRALPEPPVVTNLMRNLYRMRRRLFEYAGA